MFRDVYRFIFFFFFSDTATTEIYTLSLHDALPIYCDVVLVLKSNLENERGDSSCVKLDRKSTRLNSSHSQISYAVFCLKKKKIITALDNLHLIQARLSD